ncbi:MAG: hypothetical protein P1U40_11480 [Coxiellaceae bacterium]|nr:hypothetical protein [Coxiellaceae bacterium]
MRLDIVTTATIEELKTHILPDVQALEARIAAGDFESSSAASKRLFADLNFALQALISDNSTASFVTDKKVEPRLMRALLAVDAGMQQCLMPRDELTFAIANIAIKFMAQGRYNPEASFTLYELLPADYVPTKSTTPFLDALKPALMVREIKSLLNGSIEMLLKLPGVPSVDVIQQVVQARVCVQLAHMDFYRWMRPRVRGKQAEDKDLLRISDLMTHVIGFARYKADAAYLPAGVDTLAGFEVKLKQIGLLAETDNIETVELNAVCEHYQLCLKQIYTEHDKQLQLDPAAEAVSPLAIAPVVCNEIVTGADIPTHSAAWLDRLVNVPGNAVLDRHTDQLTDYVLSALELEAGISRQLKSIDPSAPNISVAREHYSSYYDASADTAGLVEANVDLIMKVYPILQAFALDGKAARSDTDKAAVDQLTAALMELSTAPLDKAALHKFVTTFYQLRFQCLVNQSPKRGVKIDFKKSIPDMDIHALFVMIQPLVNQLANSLTLRHDATLYEAVQSFAPASAVTTGLSSSAGSAFGSVTADAGGVVPVGGSALFGADTREDSPPAEGGAAPAAGPSVPLGK